MNKANEELLKNCFEKLNINFDQSKLNLFKDYLDQIISFNKVINITSIVEEKEIIIKHFVDSMSSALAIDYFNQKVIDIGTGSAGFPGLPIKIVFPNIEITFVDSSIKKSNILKTICKRIGLDDLKIISENVEKIGREYEFRENFDIVVTRALGKIRTLVEYGIPLLKVGGHLIIYKGNDIEEEVENSCRSLYELKSEIVKNIDIILPFSDYKRRIIVVEKLGITDSKYPRRIGLPKKRPI